MFNGKLHWSTMQRIFFGVALWCSCLLQGAESSVHQYSEGRFINTGNASLFFGGSEGMRGSTSQGSMSGVANGRSYIRFDFMQFRRTKESAARQSGNSSDIGLIQAIIFEVSDRDKIGALSYDGRDRICCTPDLAKEEGCKQGEVIIRQSAYDANWPFSIRVRFKGASLEAIMPSESVNISKTGLYNLLFVSCDPQLKSLVIDGTTVWKNPTGYLPGRIAPLMTFYGVMSLAYVILGLAWFSQSTRFWKDLLNLQNYLTAIIALGMLEVTLRYFEYVNFNASGHRSMGITVWAETFGAVKKTLSRLLILAMSMGYGVVMPILGGLSTKVILLGATYFFAAEALDIIENVGTINDISGTARLLLVLPVAILDAVIILWTFMSLSKTLEKLQAKRMVAKLDLYRKFTNTLAICVILSVAWIGYEFYLKATDPFSEGWQSAWTFTAFWNILSFSLLCVICALWSPSQNSTRYAYSEDAVENFDDEEVPLKPNVTVEPEKSSLNSDKNERKPINTDVSSLRGDLEENKRE